jgi:trimeric autotransporter adhesin
LRDTLLNKTKIANISLSLTAPNSALLGQQAVYQFEIRNAGLSTAAQPNVILQLPPSLAMVALTPSQGSCTRAVISVCRLGAIAVGGRASVRLTVKSLAKGQAWVSATAQSIELDTSLADNSIQHVITIK